MWILTREYNDYDQHGEYFEDAWLEKPSLEELQGSPACSDLTTDYIKTILNGHGRIGNEDSWFNLRPHKNE